MEKSRLEMEFMDVGSKKFKIAIDEPKNGITPEEVKDAMEAIVASNIFTSTEGDLAGVAGAKIVTTTVNELEF